MPPATTQELVSRLTSFWQTQGCRSVPAFDGALGQATLAPSCFLRLLGAQPVRQTCEQLLRQPARGRYGLNPLVKSRELLLQVVLKPAELLIDELFVKSLKAAGFELDLRDVRLSAEDFRLPAVGLEGTGWRAALDGIDAARMSFWLRLGGEDLAQSTLEIVYAVERLALVQATLADEASGASPRPSADQGWYREAELSAQAFEVARPEILRVELESALSEADSCLRAGLSWPAYERTLEALHLIDRLDARGVSSAGARAGYEAETRRIALWAARAKVFDSKEQGQDLGEEQPESAGPMSPVARDEGA